VATGVVSKVIAASVGLCAFAVALVAGLAAQNPLDAILTRALIALVACQLVGYFLGIVCENVIDDAAAKYTRRAVAEPAASTGQSGQREKPVQGV
jgi:tetrahydromethanopterin S-methyltransferase subunit C